MLNFGLTGIYMIIKFKSLRECLFQDCLLSDFFSEIQSQDILGWLALANVVALVVAKYIFLIIVRAKYEILDVKRKTPKDYTLMMKLPPKKINRSQTIQENVNRIINDPKRLKLGGIVDIVKVNPIFDIREFHNVTNKLMIIEKKISGEKNPDKVPKKFLEKKENLRKEYQKIRSEFSKEMFKKFTGWVLVTLNTEQEVKVVMNRFQVSIIQCRLRNRYRVQEPPEPNDIIWQSFGFTRNQRNFRRFLTFFFTFIVIGASFGAILAFKYIQRKIDETFLSNSKNAYTINLIISFVISFMISITNFILHQILLILTRLETFKTYSSHFAEIVFKILIAKFINTAIIILVTSKIISKDTKWNMFGFSGVYGNMIIVMLMSIFTDSLFWLLDPRYLLKLIRRYSITKNPSNTIQGDANEAFEGYNLSIAEIYFTSFKAVAVSFFYQFFLPYGLVISMIQLIMIYVIVKYVLVNRSIRPLDFEFVFTRKMIKNFELMILILSLGYLTFDMILQGDNPKISKYSLIMIGISGVEWILGINVFKDCFKRRVDVKSENTYRNTYLKFFYDYDRMNPITQREALKIFTDEAETAKNKEEVVSLRDVPLDNDKFAKGINDYTLYNQRILNPGERMYITDDILMDQGIIETPGLPLSEETNLNLYDIQEQNMQLARADEPYNPNISTDNPNSMKSQTTQLSENSLSPNKKISILNKQSLNAIKNLYFAENDMNYQMYQNQFADPDNLFQIPEEDVENPANNFFFNNQNFLNNVDPNNDGQNETVNPDFEVTEDQPLILEKINYQPDTPYLYRSNPQSKGIPIYQASNNNVHPSSDKKIYTNLSGSENQIYVDPQIEDSEPSNNNSFVVELEPEIDNENQTLKEVSDGNNVKRN